MVPQDNWSDVTNDRLLFRRRAETCQDESCVRSNTDSKHNFDLSSSPPHSLYRIKLNLKKKFFEQFSHKSTSPHVPREGAIEVVVGSSRKKNIEMSKFVRSSFFFSISSIKILIGTNDLTMLIAFFVTWINFPFFFFFMKVSSFFGRESREHALFRVRSGLLTVLLLFQYEIQF